MNSYLKSGIVLCSICIIIAIALGGVNAITAPEIAKNEQQATLNALSVVYPGSDSFDPIDLGEYKDSGLPSNILEAYSASDGGVVIKINATGYASDMIILCGVNPAGEVVKAECLSSNETWGREKTFGQNFEGKTLDNVDTVATATSKTENGYKKAITDVLGAALVLGGGSYDSRTDAEIKRDAALPAADGQFDVYFYAEAIEGLDAVYAATNGEGYVLVYGDSFVGVDKAGKVTSAVVGVDEEFKPVIDEAYVGEAAADMAKLLATTSSAFDFSSYEVSKRIDSIEKTASGNYIIVVRANGYDAQSDYSPTKMPIKIKVSVSAEGKVICTKTLEHKETEGIGSVCADPDYYSKFNGTDSESVGSVDTVAGATKTTEAYRAAIANAIAAVNIIEAADGEGGTSNE